LTVSNAAVKQSDNKVVVLTTAVQKGGDKYTVTLNEKAIGSFTGVSAVVPTKIDITTQSVQGKVGAQAILSADVHVKQAGIPVTFNVKADTNNTLNKDQVFEAVTNADGIAQFSYTQYAAGTDSVVAYPTGAPAVRSLGYVFWGVDTILTVEDVTAGATVNNGANKTYKVKYLDPKTGLPVSGKRFVVSFEENINVNVNQLSKARVNNVEPAQLLNGTAPTGAVVITDAKGEATFTVTGENTAVTPIVFEQKVVSTTATSTAYSYTYTNDLLQAKASKVTFGAVQADYKLVLKREGLEEAAKGLENGREYTVVVTDKDGKIAKNETVNVAFNEDLDGVIGTQTAAEFVKEDAAGNLSYNGKKITVVTNAKGEASFVVASENNKDYVTPIAWIDVNSAYANEGKLDIGEASVIGEMTYFADAKLTGAALTTYNAADVKTKDIVSGSPAIFKVALTNQSGMPISLASAGYNAMQTSFTVYNTGANEVVVAGQTVSPNRSYTVSATDAASISVTTADSTKSTSVRVVANGVAKSTTGAALDYNFTSTETTATFTASTEVPALYTGSVASYNSENKTLTFASKSPVKYAGAAGYTYKYFGGNGAQLADAASFITELKKGAAVVTYKLDTDNVVTFSVVSSDGVVGNAPQDTIGGAATPGTYAGTVATAYQAEKPAAAGVYSSNSLDVFNFTGTLTIGDGTALHQVVVPANGATTATDVVTYLNAQISAYNTANAATAVDVTASLLAGNKVQLKGNAPANGVVVSASTASAFPDATQAATPLVAAVKAVYNYNLAGQTVLVAGDKVVVNGVTYTAGTANSTALKTFDATPITLTLQLAQLATVADGVDATFAVTSAGDVLKLTQRVAGTGTMPANVTVTN